jgi:hypothetical protein
VGQRLRRGPDAGHAPSSRLTQQQRDRYQDWFDNARRLKELVAKLEIASVHAVDTVEGWSTDNPTPDKPPS